MNKKPIGIFDSGLGGLTVVKEITKILPNEDIVYLGDTARVPYGSRSKEVITEFSLQDANFLLEKKVKCIVIACNTVSSMSGDLLKRKIKIPVFSVIEPALSEAKKITNGTIGVIGTRATIGSGAYKVDYALACPLLVPFIEEGDIDSPALKLVLKSYLEKVKEKKVNTLILGCTHYPIIEKLIQNEMGKSVKLVNPEKIIAKEVKDFLTAKNLLNTSKKKGEKLFYVTDLTDRFQKTAEIFLKEKVRGKISKVDVTEN